MLLRRRRPNTCAVPPRPLSTAAALAGALSGVAAVAGALSAVAAAVAPAAAQTIVRWDTAFFDQPGQRSLFLRTPGGGVRGLPLGGGDVNGDGRDDVLLCAFSASEAFLFFSLPVIGGIREAVPAPGEVTRIAGAPTLGVECSSGDLNGDGFDDLLLGAPGVSGPGGTGSGAVYVVFGSPALPAEVDVAASPGVLQIRGADAGDHFGVWVDATDVDGDGVDDLLVGAPDADGPVNDRPDAGEALVVFGGADLAPGALDVRALENAGRTFKVYGADPGDGAGSCVDAGRIDAGAVAEFVVGAALNRAAQSAYGGGFRGGDGPDESRPDAGEVAVVFDPQRGRSVDLAAPGPDVALVFGADPGDYAGEELDVADADGDGAGDVLIGALTAAGPGNLRPLAGEAYLVYGGEGLRGRRIDLAQPAEGVTTIYGPSAGGITGDTARFIDVDGDGRGDIFIGSPTGTFLGPRRSEEDAVATPRTGALFFIRSPAGRLPAVIDLDHPPIDALPFGVILAAEAGDILAYSLIRADADGDGADDVVVNGMIGSGLANQFPQAGEAYVIDGQTLAAALRPFASGDVNGDGSVDVRDLERVVDGLVGRRPLSEAEIRAADTNGNGALDGGDLVGVLDRVLLRNVVVPGSEPRVGLTKDLAAPRYVYGAPSLAYGESLPGHASRIDGAGSPAGASGLMAAVFSLHPAGAAGVSSGSTLGGASITATTGAAQGSAAAPHLPMTALEVTFALASGSPAPAVVPLSASTVVSGVREGTLRVVVFAGQEIPVGVPLFGLSGAAPTIAEVRGATAGGSLRDLEPLVTSPARPARGRPPLVRKPSGAPDP